MFNNYFKHLTTDGLLKNKVVLTALVTMMIVTTMISNSSASITVTQPTGGQNLSTDLATGGPSAGYSALGSIVINDGANNDFPNNQANKTIILTVPANWQFQSGTGTVTKAGSNITSASIAVTSTTITVTFSTGNTTSSNNSLTISGIMVQATSGTALTSVNITRTGGTFSTATGFATSGATSICAALSQKAGTLNTFVFSTIANGKTVGTAFTGTTITAEDFFGNILNTTNGNDFTGTVNLSTSAAYGSVSPATTAACVNGVVTPSITVTQAVSQTLTATAGAVTGTSNSFTVNAGTATKLQIILPGETAEAGSGTGKTGIPSAQINGVAFSFTVNLVDANWNLVSGTNTVTITSNDGSATLPGNAALVAGTKSFTITNKTNSASTTVTASATGLTANTCTAYTVTTSALSDIIANGSYTYTANIAYGSYQTASPTALTTANSVGAMGLTIRDGGVSSPDADGASTTLTAITFSTGGSTAIRAAALFNGSTNLKEIAVNGATSIAFSGLSIVANDNSTQNFELRVTFQSAVTDDQQIQFTVTSATALATGSTFAAADAGGAVSDITGNNNQIVVTATKLIFGQQPSNVAASAVMSPSVTLKAVDANNNVDIDYVSSISLTTTATFSSAATTSTSAVAGVATFSNLAFTTVVTAKIIAATSGSLTTSGNSSTFNVTAFANVNTDYFRSIATANWNATAASTWQASHNNTDWYAASLTPDNNSAGITIASPNTISISANVTADQITVSSGAQLNINDGITLTLNNGGGTDLDVFGTVQEISTTASTTSISTSSGASIVFENGGLYKHNFTFSTNAGTIPTATWADGSTCEIIGCGANTTTHIANMAQSFYNFTWNCTGQTTAYGMQGALTTVRGDFTMQSSGSAPQVVYGLGASSGTFNMTVGGDFIISSGYFDFLNSGASTGPFSLTIGGSYNQTGGTFQSDYSSNGGLPVHFTGSGKSFIQSAGTLTTTNMNFFVDNGASITLNNGISTASSSSFTVSNGGTLYCGTNAISGTGAFTLSAGGTLGIGSTSGINLTTGAGSSTGNITTSSRSYGNANYIYNAATSGNTGTGLPSTIVSLTVNLGSSGSLSITNASTLAISSTLSLQNGLLTPNGTNIVSVNNSSVLSVANYSSASYVNGELSRNVATGNSYDFPVGNSSHYELASLNYHSVTGTAITSILAFFNTGLPATGPNPATCFIAGTPIAHMLDAGYWTLTPTPSTFTTVNYDITLNESGYTSSLPGAASNIGIIKRHNSSDNWHGATTSGGGYDGKQGNETSSTQSISGGIATAVRTGVGGFSDYGIAYAGVPLPIELSSFTANVITNQQVSLKWATQSEINNQYFAVERSADGLSFDSIGIVQGAGNSDVVLNYNMLDNSPLTGVSYYRLKQVDFNGNSVYSNLQSVNIQASDVTITQYVSSSNSNILSVITSSEQTSATLYITDNLGRVLLNKTVNINSGVNHEAIDMNMFSTGIYFAVLKTSNQSIVSEFFFKP